MLKDLLDKKQCFKLVCGAGNEDVQEVEKLVAIYSLAGCRFFDLCAKPEIVQAAKNALKFVGNEEKSHLCVSIGISGDPHVTKAKIDEAKCVKCGKCFEICPHEAILKKDNFQIINERCLGCAQCEKNCPNGAISMQTQLCDYEKILPEIIKMGIGCIEFHVISEDETEVFEKWEMLNKIFDGMLCISVDRSCLGDVKLVARIKKMLKIRKAYTTIIQADGVAMSGNNEELGTTLQAVATAQLFQNAKLPAYIMMSGGTNTKSTQLARDCGVVIDCLAVGSYARKIVKKYLKKDIFSDENAMQEAVKIAKSLVDVSLGNMG